MKTEDEQQDATTLANRNSPVATDADVTTNPSKLSIKLVLGLVALVAIACVIAAVINSKNTTAKVVTVPAPHIATIKITDQGFTPTSLSVNRGTVVIWQGTQTSGPVIIASNPYPKDNSTVTLKSTQVGNGANYRYKFTKSGTYNYHDDLNPSVNGTVIVK